MTTPIHDVVIIGGGLSGATTAIHLVRTAKAPLSIAVIEPRDQLGRGLAYSNAERDYRLNGPAARHTIYPDELSHFQDWYLAEGLDRRDPGAADAPGYFFPSRYDFGSYLDVEAQKHIAQNPSGSDLKHILDRAVDVVEKDCVFQITLASGKLVQTRVVVVAAAPGRATMPAAFSAYSHDDVEFLPDPWDTDRVRRIPKSASVLLIGMAQTASDVAAILLKYGHTGPITLVSRRGIRPRARPPLNPNSYLRDEIPENEKHRQFLDQAGSLKSASTILQQLRREARVATDRSHSWLPAMEMLRDLITDHWYQFPLAEKRRFLRHGRTWYDVHRFRLPPQIETSIEKARERGQLRFISANIVDVISHRRHLEVRLRERGKADVTTVSYDVAVNCTGLENQPSRTNSPFLQSLITRGYAKQHGTELGFDVDVRGHAVDRNGDVNKSLFIVGPLTYGAFADQQGSVFIARRILGMIPKILEEVERRGSDQSSKR
jgi:uncharacterized NAD(P)/FAD-binding protein YdhS